MNKRNYLKCSVSWVAEVASEDLVHLHGLVAGTQRFSMQSGLWQKNKHIQRHTPGWELHC